MTSICEPQTSVLPQTDTLNRTSAELLPANTGTALTTSLKPEQGVLPQCLTKKQTGRPEAGTTRKDKEQPQPRAMSDDGERPTS